MKLYVIPLLFLLLTFCALALALAITWKHRAPQKQSKYSPFSRKVAHTVSLVHLAEGRLMVLKPRIENSQSSARYRAQSLIKAAEEKLKSAKEQLDNDELEEANKLLDEILSLLDQAESRLDQ